MAVGKIAKKRQHQQSDRGGTCPLPRMSSLRLRTLHYLKQNKTFKLNLKQVIQEPLADKNNNKGILRRQLKKPNYTVSPVAFPGLFKLNSEAKMKGNIVCFSELERSKIMNKTHWCRLVQVLFHHLPSSMIIHLGKQEKMIQQPYGRPRQSISNQALSWPSPSHCAHSRNESMIGRYLSFPIPL